MDAEHYYSKADGAAAKWTVIPYMGRTRSGISLQPYNASVEGNQLNYRFTVPEGVKKMTVHIITAATLAFQRSEGHRYSVGLEGGVPEIVNFNGELNEEPQNVYRIMYPTVASRVIERTVCLEPAKEGRNTLEFKALDPGVVLEKIVIDFGGYEPSFLYMDESPLRRD